MKELVEKLNAAWAVFAENADKNLQGNKAAKTLGQAIPEKVAADGKEFRKFLAKILTGKVDLEGEKAASSFLCSIGVDFIEWPYNWKNPSLGSNRAILDEGKVRIIRIDSVRLDKKKKLLEGSVTQIR